jgi:hypothetical protein
MRVKSADGFTLTLGKDPTHDGEGHIVVHLTHRDGRQLWASFRVADIVEEISDYTFFGGATEREKPPAEPQPPGELVAFAERHGVDLKRWYIGTDDEQWIAGAANDVRVGTSDEGFWAKASGSGEEFTTTTRHAPTIDEALAKLAAATVDDEAAHLEVVGLIRSQTDACILPDGMLHNTSGDMWWVSFRSYPMQGPAARSPWLAVIALQGEMHEKADEAMRIEKACREWRKTNA